MSILLTCKVLLAYLLDLLIGDPRWLPHPVIGMGKLTTWVERLVHPVYLLFTRKQWAPQLTGRLLGILFPVIVVGSAFGLTSFFVDILHRISPLAALVAEIVLISTTIATKGLAAAGREILRELRRGNLSQARVKLSYVVGRDTERLDEGEITRGAVETVAENIVDAVTSPVFYALIGGAPLAMAYRAVNTLDSMVGYKNERYLHLGWASARLDDVCNFIPARLTFFILICCAWLLRLDSKNAFRIGRRDAQKHPSPNSGWTESAVAGALHIQLGGVNTYQGVPSHRATLGDASKPLCSEHIQQTISLLFATTFCFTIAGTIVVILYR